MDRSGKLVMLGFHVAGLVICTGLYAFGEWWQIGGWWLLGPWLALGVFSLVVYIMTWTDTPAIWWWPYLIACWPIMWAGGLVHPLR